MRDNDLDGPDSGRPDPDEEDLSEEGRDEATVRLPVEYDDVLDTEAAPTQSIPGLEEGSAEDSEVYVILPDGEGVDIPVVETEVVEGVGLLDAATPSEKLEDVPIRDSNPLFEATQLEDVGTVVFDKDLDQLADELDDDLLGGTDAALLESSDAEMLDEDERDVFELTSDDGPGEGDFYDGMDEGSSSGKSRRPRVLLSLAAALFLGVGGYFACIASLQEGQDTEGSLVAFADTHPEAPGGASDLALGGKAPDAAVIPVSGESPDGGSNADTGAVDPVVASREAFHEKLLLAIEFGYGGLVADE